MQQCMRLRHVGHIASRADDGVNQAGCHVHTYMRLHAEVPSVALLRLVHFGISFTVFFLRRRRRSDQRGIDDGPLAHQKTFTGKVSVDFIEDPARQFVVLQQSSELQQRGRIGRRFVRQVDTNKSADRLTIADRILNGMPLKVANFRQLAALVAALPGVQPHLDKFNQKPLLRPGVIMELTPPAPTGDQLAGVITALMLDPGNLHITGISATQSKTFETKAAFCVGPARYSSSASNGLSNIVAELAIAYGGAGATGFDVDGKELLDGVGGRSGSATPDIDKLRALAGWQP